MQRDEQHRDQKESLIKHYAGGDVVGAVRTTLNSLVAEARDLTPEDTAPFDEFHIRGREATVELAARLNLQAGQRVLDVGCGLGGPSRHLAWTYGCRVSGIDLTAPYCEAAGLIAERLGLDGALTYLHGDALNLPFPDGSFDVVWTQHTAMNIPDKGRLYGEMRRVLQPGGILAIYDVLAGPGGEPYFPLPWARDPSMSFLLPEAGMRRCLADAGFVVQEWRDTTSLGRDWFRALAAGKGKTGDGRGGKAVPGLQTILGPELRVMSKNVMRNLDESRIALVEILAR
jgi:SAM-dependent methyltransferase